MSSNLEDFLQFKFSYVSRTQSAQSVEMLCICENEATFDYRHGSALKLRNTCRRRWLVNLAQSFSKYESTPKRAWLRVKNGPRPRRSKPELCVFNVTTACLCLPLAKVLEKTVVFWHQTRHLQLTVLSEIIQSLFSSYDVWGLGREVFTKPAVDLGGAQKSSATADQVAVKVFLKIIECLNEKIQRTGKNLIWFNFSHMPFVKQTKWKK